MAAIDIGLYRPCCNGNQFAVNNKLEVYIEPVHVQQQEGEMDCGIFSIANAYNAAHAGEFGRVRKMYERCNV